MRWNFLANIVNYIKDSSLKMKLGFFIISLIVIIFILIIIIIIQKNRKKHGQKKIRNVKKTIRITRTRKPEQDLLVFDKKVKKFFKEYLKDKSQMTYGEIAQRLRGKRKNKFANFCDEISYALYSENEINKEDVSNLINNFNNIIKNKKPKIEKNKIKKKETKKQIKHKKPKPKRKKKKLL